MMLARLIVPFLKNSHKESKEEVKAKEICFAFSELSERRLVGVHPKLVKTVRDALSVSPVDIIVVEGVRTKERQLELYSYGRTKLNPNTGTMAKVTNTKNSMHIKKEDGFGHAIDLAPYVYGRVAWNDIDAFKQIAECMKQAANKNGIKITWGGDWKNFKDYPHYQIDLKE